MLSTAPTVAVAGGSIAGLASALALARNGFDVQVFERSDGRLQSRGAGIVIQEALTNMLDRYTPEGSKDLDVSCTHRAFLAKDGSAELMPMPQSFTSWDSIYLRLRNAWPAERYHARQEIEGITAIETDAPEVRFADGKATTFDMVVAADGVRSRIRETLFPQSRPTYAGYVAFRGVVPTDEHPDLAAQFRDRFTFFSFENGHILAYLIPDAREPNRQFINWVWYWNAPEGETLNALLTDREGKVHNFSVPPERLRPEVVAAQQAIATDLLAPQFRDLVLATEHLFLQPVMDASVPRMAQGRVILVGDASFVVRPHTAYSTAKAATNAMALERYIRPESLASPSGFDAWEKDQLELGRYLGRSGREAGDRSQFPERQGRSR